MSIPTNTRTSLNDDHILNGVSDISFVDDSFPNDPASGSSRRELRITYPTGSYSPSTVVLHLEYNRSYEVTLDSDFQWAQGKLPGPRGGPDDGYSGGAQPIGMIVLVRV